jgi:hypothetical protein
MGAMSVAGQWMIIEFHGLLPLERAKRRHRLKMIISAAAKSGQEQKKLSQNMKYFSGRRFAGFPVTFLSTGSVNLGKRAADRSPKEPDAAPS